MKNDEIKRANRRALPKYLLVICLSAVFGGVLGLASGIAGAVGLGEWVRTTLASGLRAAAPWGIPVTSGVLLGAGVWLYGSARKLCDGWDGEDEAVADRVEGKLNAVLLLTTLALVADFFFLAVSTVYDWETPLFTLGIVGEMLLSCWGLVVLQQKTVDLTKRINPEKTVSAYDMKFHKKWLESCDEAERAQIGQAAYKSYRTVSNVCLWLWVGLLVLNIVFGFGLLPMAVVLTIWAVGQVSYILECIRLGKRA